jgi:hypothetical protein
MSIMGDLGALSGVVTLLSGEVDPFWWSCTARWPSLRSLCEPMVDDLDLIPSESLSDTSMVGECGDDSLLSDAIGRLSSLRVAPKSSFDAFRFSISNELVSERFAFMKMVPPPRYWFRNSDRFSAVSWTWRPCFISQCALRSIIRNSFCSRTESVSAPLNLVRMVFCSSQSSSSRRRRMAAWVFRSDMRSTSAQSRWNHTMGQWSHEVMLGRGRDSALPKA